MATVGYLVHQENVLSQALDNVKDLRDALALERRANDGEVSKSTRDFWSVLLANAASLHSSWASYSNKHELNLILPAPLAKISRPPPNPTRIPRSGEKWLIGANGTEINLAHLPHIACAHIAGGVRPIQPQGVGGA